MPVRQNPFVRLPWGALRVWRGKIDLGIDWYSIGFVGRSLCLLLILCLL